VPYRQNLLVVFSAKGSRTLQAAPATGVMFSDLQRKLSRFAERGVWVILFFAQENGENPNARQTSKRMTLTTNLTFQSDSDH